MADDIVKYVKTHYTAPRMVLAAAGAVDHDELATLAGDYFGGVPTVAPEGLSYEALPSLFTGSDVREYNDDMPLAHFALAFEGLSWTHPDVFPLMLCQSLLGAVDKKNTSGKFTSSPLAKYLARDGLAESMQPVCTCYNDTGLFGLYFTANMEDKYKTADLFHHVQEEMVALTTGVSDEDVVRAKMQLKYNILQQIDGTSPTAEEIGRQMITFGRRMNLAETFARIDGIEPADVQRVAEAIMWDQEVAFAALGPGLKTVGDMNHLRRGTYWNRL
jgi:processing peptidase subunit beta